MTARAMSLHKLSLRDSNIDVLAVSSEEDLGGCDLLIFLRMQASWGFKGAAEIARKVTKKTTATMLMEVFIAFGFACCFCEERKRIDIYIQ